VATARKTGIRTIDQSAERHAESTMAGNERWLDVAAALGIIARERDAGPKNAQNILIEACASERVRSRYVTYNELLAFHAIQPFNWCRNVVLDGSIDLSRGTYCNYDDPDQAGPIQINADDLRKWLKRSHRGPKTGTVSRYAASDRALFNEMKSLLDNRKVDSATEAARRLVEADKVGGAGTEDSRTRRLAKAYLAETR
jgi:hypothetical protein